MAANENNGKIKGAMFYPVAVIFIALVILTFLMVKVIPKFEEIFKELLNGKPLPQFTQFVLDFSATFKNHILIVLGAGVAAIVVVLRNVRINKRLLNIIEPVMIVLLALVIGSIVIALFLPLISIITELGNPSHPPPTRPDLLK